MSMTGLDIQLAGITGLDISCQEDTETGLYYSLRNMQDGFATDTHKKIHKFADGSISKYIPESQLGYLSGATGVQGIQGIQGETGLPGGVQGITGLQGATGVLDYITGSFTGMLYPLEEPYVVYLIIEYVMINNKIVYLKIPAASGLPEGFNNLEIHYLPVELIPTIGTHVSCPRYCFTDIGLAPLDQFVDIIFNGNSLIFNKIPSWGFETPGDPRGLQDIICITYVK